jgi:hypothetical protein
MSDLARVGLLERQKGKLVIRDLGALLKLLSAECGEVSTAETRRLH